MGVWVMVEKERARRRSWPPPSRVVPSRWMGLAILVARDVQCTLCSAGYCIGDLGRSSQGLVNGLLRGHFESGSLFFGGTLLRPKEAPSWFFN